MDVPTPKLQRKQEFRPKAISRKPLFRRCSLRCLNFHWDCHSFLNLALAIYLCLLIFTTSDNLPVWTKMPETNIDRVWDAGHTLGTLLLKVGQRFIMFFVKLETSERKAFAQHCSWMEIVPALGLCTNVPLHPQHTNQKNQCGTVWPPCKQTPSAIVYLNDNTLRSFSYVIWSNLSLISKTSSSIMFFLKWQICQ